METVELKQKLRSLSEEMEDHSKLELIYALFLKVNAEPNWLESLSDQESQKIKVGINKASDDRF